MSNFCIKLDNPDKVYGDKMKETIKNSHKWKIIGQLIKTQKSKHLRYRKELSKWKKYIFFICEEKRKITEF